MADVTITNSAGVVFTFEAGEVEKVRSAVNADIDQSALPSSGPSLAFLFDFEGVRKIISVTGVLIASATTRTSSGTTKTILEQKQWIEQNLSGAQTAAAFTSTYESQTFDGSAFATTNIMWGSITFEEIAGDPSVLPFTIQLLVGT